MTDITPGKLIGLRRLADEHGRFKMLAVDQRPPIEEIVRRGRGTQTAPPEDVSRLKRLLLKQLGRSASALLLDPQYVFPTAIPDLPAGRGLLITLEDHMFEETSGGRLSSRISDWSVEKIRIAGADAVKLLAWYRPDSSQSVREHQQQLVAEVGDECARYDIPFVFELLLYPFPGDDDHTTGYVEHPTKRTDHVIESVQTFAEPRFGVDLFKVESPVPEAALSGEARLGDRELTEAFDELGRAAGRPWVMLSAGVKGPTFKRILELAYGAGASGYLAGRAIWWQACNDNFPSWDEMESALGDTQPYVDGLNDLTDQHALPWHQHPGFGDDGPTPPEAGPQFRAGYPPRIP